MANATDVEIYRLHVWICRISPMIWRRLLVRSDSTITDLHYTLQIAFGWSDEHLNLFHIHGQDYGVYLDSGVSFSRNPDQIRLYNFKLRHNVRFRYPICAKCSLHSRLVAKQPLGEAARLGWW